MAAARPFPSQLVRGCALWAFLGALLGPASCAGETGSTWSVLSPDPKVLTWGATPVNGGQTTGTLTVPLDPHDADSPDIQLEVVVLLSTKQPAPQGPLLVHMGGPGSDAVTGVTFGQGVGYLLDGETFDGWGISQRGVSPTTPMLGCSGSTLPGGEQGKHGKHYAISDFTKGCPCACTDGTPLVGEAVVNVNPKDLAQVEDFLKHMQDRSERCYKSPKYQLEGKGGKVYNFLDYVGTQFLAHDIEALRRAIGAEKMNLAGVSYGTYVVGVYASVYPDHVGKLVLNSPVTPVPDLLATAHGAAEASSLGVAKLVHDCGLDPECGLQDAEGTYLRVFSQLESESGMTAPAKDGTPFRLESGLLVGYINKNTADSTGDGWKVAVAVLKKLGSSESSTREEAVAQVLNGWCTLQGTATWFEYGVCVGRESVVDADKLAFYGILGSDLSGRLLVSQAMGHYRSVLREFGSVGATTWLSWVGGLFDWPVVPAPPAPLGHARLRPLVVGTLYDPSTSYAWAQAMHHAFPSGALLTWEGLGHVFVGFAKYDPEKGAACAAHVLTYLAAGVLPQNGEVCPVTKTGRW